MSSDEPGQDVITSRPVLPPPPLALGRWRGAWRAAGLVAGAGAIVLMAPVLRPALGPSALPLSVNAAVTRTGEVGVTDGTQLLMAAPVRTGAGGTADGEVEIVSQTWAPVAVSVKDNGPGIGVEDQIHLEVAIDGTVVFDGPRSELRAADSESVVLEPGQRAKVSLKVSTTGTDTDYQGRTADIRLDLSAAPVED